MDNGEINPYELLEVDITATEAEIRKAYRTRSLKVHPDRHPNNPDAAHKFHELNTAYELLLDPTKRTALDSKLKAAVAKKQRFAAYDNKRKTMAEELDRSEKAFKKAKSTERQEQEKLRMEEERIKEEGRQMMKDREAALKKTFAPVVEEPVAPLHENPPPSGPLDSTVRVNLSLKDRPELNTPDALASSFATFGPMDVSSIVFSLKPNKKNPAKPGRVTAIVPFMKTAGAFAAVMASGRKDLAMTDVTINWAGGEEPAVVQWMRDRGQLEIKGKQKHGEDNSFSTFPEVPKKQSKSTQNVSGSLSNAIDMESAILMRMRERQAERERLEREILEQEG